MVLARRVPFSCPAVYKYEDGAGNVGQKIKNADIFVMLHFELRDYFMSSVKPRQLPQVPLCSRRRCSAEDSLCRHPPRFG